MTTDDITWVIEEIDELLGAGEVGLYEFVWTLHARYPKAPAEELLHICRPALDRLLEESSVTLGWYVWPKHDRIREASEADLDDHAFDDIGDDGRYLGIERT